MNSRALLNTITSNAYSLPIVILYVTSGCNLRCMTCSYREPLPNELSLEEYRDLAEQLRRLGLRHVVYSGGEPLTRRDFPQICSIFQEIEVHQSLLTNGLLLEKRFIEIVPFLREIIVSLDGPNSSIHDSIRGLGCFDQILKGINRVLKANPRPLISIRTVLQRKNFRNLAAMIDCAKTLGVDRISFLTVDVLSDAFDRKRRGSVAEKGEILLTSEEAAEFRSIVHHVLQSHKADFTRGFIAESRSKMMHFVEYFEAFHGLKPFPRNHCNAPMVSTVITSTGEMLPCYFLPGYGDTRSGTISDQLNNDRIGLTRREVRNYSLEQCRKCVCTLRVSPTKALFDQF